MNSFFGSTFFSGSFFVATAGVFFGGAFFSGGFFSAIIEGTEQLLIKLRSFTERRRF
jgi:hypothetical protein